MKKPVDSKNPPVEFPGMQTIQFNPALTDDNFTPHGVFMALVIDVLRVSREIFYFVNLLKKQSPADRDSLAASLDEAGETIKDMFDKLTAGFFPVGNCEKLDLLSHQLYFQLEVALGPDHARALVDKLKQTHRVELLHREFIAGIIDPRELVLLDEAASHFLTTAKTLWA
ncbi:MAG: hypothetical protein KIT62_03590 [Cyclobacteriaceae bacterium]|nr:hypothetical protein [Cyclobacteriaceae bacterium]